MNSVEEETNRTDYDRQEREDKSVYHVQRKG